MKHEKSPQLRAGCLGAYKSGDEIIIANSNTKNNAPDLILNRNNPGRFRIMLPYGGKVKTLLQRRLI